MFRVRTLRVGILSLLLATCAWQLWPEVRAYWPRPVGGDEVLIPVTRDGMAGYIDPNGRERLPFVWESTYAFGTSGLAMVRRDDKYGEINRHGQIVVEPRWVGEWPLSMAGFGWEVSEALDAAGWARVARDGKWGWIDRHGLIAIEPQWEAVMDFDPAGLALVRHDDKLGWIDRQGRVVIKPRWKYHNQTVESQGRAWYVVFGWNESLLYRLWAKLPAAWPQPKSPMRCACYDSTGRLIWSSDDRFRRRLIAGACATILVLYGLYAGLRWLRAAEANRSRRGSPPPSASRWQTRSSISIPADCGVSARSRPPGHTDPTMLASPCVESTDRSASHTKAPRVSEQARESALQSSLRAFVPSCEPPLRTAISPDWLNRSALFRTRAGVDFAGP